MRYLILLLNLGMWPLAAQPAITCPSSLNQGGAVTCTSNVPVSWSLSGSGNLISIDSTHAIYMAPAHVTPQKQWGGCQVLPNDHIYNKRIDSLPLDPNSAAMIAQGGNQVSANLPGDFGINSVGPGTPTQSMVFNYTPGSNGSFYFPARPNLKIEGGADTTQIGGVDHHFITVAHDTCQAQELYSPYPTGFNIIECPTCNAQSGTSYSLSSYALPSVGTDAASMPLVPLTYTKAEILAGSIKHAGRFTMAGGFILPGVYRWPARATTGGGSPWPMGARVRLKASFDVSSLVSPYAQALATAWKQYGMILADIGSDWNYTIEQESYPQPLVDAFNQLHAMITSANFEVVDESALMVSGASGLTTSPDVLVTGRPVNGPNGSASIGLIGVTLGTDYPSLTVQAGAGAFQVNVWVNGSSNTGLTWSLSGDGSLSPSGVYSPPSSEPSVTTATITVTSAADGAVSLAIPVTLLPGGTIRINEGDSSSFTDSAGYTWYGDMNTSALINPLAGSLFHEGAYAPTWNTADNTALLGYIAGGLDSVHPIRVPNGNYQVQFLTGASAGEVVNQRCSDFEAQGQTGTHSFDVPGRGYSTLTGVTITVPAQVTNGLLTVAHRWAPCLGTGRNIPNWASQYLDYDQTYAPLVGAFSVIGDASPPHITIDNTLNSGQSLNLLHTLQLHAVGWYMPNSVTWSVSGGGSIDASGLYTAPLKPVNGQAIITATSTVDPLRTANTAIPLTFGVITVVPDSARLAPNLTTPVRASISGVAYTNVTWSVVQGAGSITPAGVYTAPSSVVRLPTRGPAPAEITVTIRATSNDDATQYGETTIIVTRLLPSIRVNCGDNGSFTDANGHLWDADPGMLGSTVMRYNIRSAIANASPDMQWLYQSATYGTGDSYYAYSVPNSTYQVTLKFADYGNNPPGTYLASWFINGTNVLNEFDVEAAAGGPYTAVDRRFVVTVLNNNITIQGVSVRGRLMQLNGFEIDDLGPPISLELSGKGGLSGRTQ